MPSVQPTISHQCIKMLTQMSPESPLSVAPHWVLHPCDSDTTILLCRDKETEAEEATVPSRGSELARILIQIHLLSVLCCFFLLQGGMSFGHAALAPIRAGSLQRGANLPDDGAPLKTAISSLAPREKRGSGLIHSSHLPLSGQTCSAERGHSSSHPHLGLTRVLHGADGEG